MRVVFAIAVMLGALAGSSVARADEPGDARRLTDAEHATVLPLLCRNPSADAKGNVTCRALIGHNLGPKTPLSLDAIAVGAFSRAGADEAYVTYSSLAEPHVNNFGGGVLLRRAGGVWKLVRWYPGGQRDRCLALPGKAPARMLCLSGYVGQGEVDSSVWIERVPPAGDGVAVLKAQDARQTDNPGYSCQDLEGRGVLLSVGDLARATESGTLAVAKITYATAKDAAASCRAGDFAHVKETMGAVRFVLAKDRVRALTPEKFAPVDY